MLPYTTSVLHPILYLKKIYFYKNRHNQFRWARFFFPYKPSLCIDLLRWPWWSYQWFWARTCRWGAGRVKYSKWHIGHAEPTHLAACQIMMPSMTSTTEQTIARIHIFFLDFCCDKENRDMVGCWQGLHWQTALSEIAADSPDSRRLSGAALFLVLRELQHSPHWPRCYLQGRIYSKVKWEPMKLEGTVQLHSFISCSISSLFFGAAIATSPSFKYRLECWLQWQR